MEQVSELVCNLDDMTPEAIAFAQELLMGVGALDVYTTPIGMKKSRLGTSFTCMCRLEDKDRMLGLIFKHTSTLGVREYVSNRYSMQRENTKLMTKFGEVRVKKAHSFGVEKSKVEYDDITKIALEKGISIREVLDEI